MRRYKPTSTMLRIMRNVAAGDYPGAGCHGMSQHGGWACAMYALMRRGFMTSHHQKCELTDAGRAALAEAEAAKS